MWIIDLLPSWIFHLIVIAGAVGIVISQFMRILPMLYPYKSPILWGSIVILVAGIWVEGGLANEAKWEARVKELETKIAISEEKMKEANDQLAEKLADKTVALEQRKVETIKYIEIEREKIDATCTVPQEFIFIVNKAAE